MKMRTAGIFLGITCATVLLTGCGGKSPATQAAEESEVTEKEGTGEDAETEAAIKEAEEANVSEKASGDHSSEDGESEPKGTVCISLPDEERQEIHTAGELLVNKLTEDNYEVQVFYAENDSKKQEQQIGKLLDYEPQILIVDPVDPYGLTDALAEAAEKNVTIFSYEDLIMDSGNIAYYVTFDKRQTGQKIAEHIIEKNDLKKLQSNGGTATIEFFMGSGDNLGALFLYNGVMEILEPYLEDGTLVCPSGQTAFADVATADFDVETAAERYRSILSEYYQKDQLPAIICTGFDGACYGILDALDEAEIYPGSEAFPYLNGVGCEIDAVRAIAENRVAFDLYMDPKSLSDICASMVDTCISGESPEVNNYEQYDNGVKLIRTNTCSAELIDVNNYEMLIDKGLFTAEEVAPRFTATPTPSPSPEPTATPTPSPSPEPTVTPTPSPSPEPTPSPSPEPTATPTPAPSPELTDTPDITSGQEKYDRKT